MTMKPEREKAFDIALDSFEDNELRALFESLATAKLHQKHIETLAHEMGEIARLAMKERGADEAQMADLERAYRKLPGRLLDRV
jgi:hypothetical protein